MKEKLQEIIKHSDRFIIGKAEKIKMALVCILARGHLLIEDIPGVGKTTMVKYLARVLGLKMGRIQFTNDLLPSDILGVHIFDEDQKAFRFKKGPIFAQLILADELNRATPKTQSALLQVMEEYHVTLDGNHYELELPFSVMATQNPNEQVGTHLLPEGQRDRFLMRLSLGVPEREDEIKLLKEENIQLALEGIDPLFTEKELTSLQKASSQVHASDMLLNYIVDVLDYTRASSSLLGLSPRAGLDIVRAAKAYSFIEGREFVEPEDVQKVVPYVIGHRLQIHQHGRADSGELLAKNLIEQIELT